MKNIAIVAEYNPFHSGHKRQIEYVKNVLHADNCIVVMSGDFVQRGEPAILDKRVRTQMAITAGADLVLELPTAYATSSAEFFASAAIDMIVGSGICDGICFGCEDPDTELLDQLADLFLHEPPEYSALLKENLASGMAFPLAREKAASQILTENSKISDFLKKPNNILALEYVKEIKRLHSGLQIYPLKRDDTGYHSTEMSNGSASATAIRNYLKDNSATISADPALISELREFIPSDILPLLSENSGDLRYPNDFSDMIYYSLALKACESDDLSKRIFSLLPKYTAFEQFTDLVKTKNITRSHVARYLIHSLLNISGNLLISSASGERMPQLYLRVLGIKKESAELLALLNKSALPVVTTVSRDYEKLSETQKELFDKDIFASAIYSRRSEFTYELVKV